METITAKQLNEKFKEDPTWAKNLTEPVKVIDFFRIWKAALDTRPRPIVLSPLLHFMGRDKNGNVADFDWSDQLKVLKGTFDGGVVCSRSALEKVDPNETKILRPNIHKHAMHLDACEDLSTLEGTYPGTIVLRSSGVEVIENLKIEGDLDPNLCLSLFNCKKLKRISGTFPGFIDFENSSIEDTRELVITGCSTYKKSANFNNCKLLKTADGDYMHPPTFLSSSVEKVGNLIIRNPDNWGSVFCIERSPLAKNQEEIQKLVRKAGQHIKLIDLKAEWKHASDYLEVAIEREIQRRKSLQAKREKGLEFEME